MLAHSTVRAAKCSVRPTATSCDGSGLTNWLVWSNWRDPPLKIVPPQTHMQVTFSDHVHEAAHAGCGKMRESG